MATNPKFIFFTDFDGTITQKDSNDHMIDNLGFGAARREALNDGVLLRGEPFRDAFALMLDSITAPFSECVDVLLKNIQLDTGFAAFYAWAKANNVPVVVLSGGMRPVVEALLTKFLGSEEAGSLRIVCNDVEAREGKSINDESGWRIVYHDDSPYGHDKSLELRQYSQLPEGERPFLFYAGDGVSDLSAARETDLMFAKVGKDLVRYCKNEGIPYTEFRDFSDILDTVRAIVQGRKTVKDVVERA